MDESRGEETPTPVVAVAPFVAPVARGEPIGTMGFVPGILRNGVDARQFEVDLTTSSHWKDWA
jgi:hypothetical protein